MSKTKKLPNFSNVVDEVVDPVKPKMETCNMMICDNCEHYEEYITGYFFDVAEVTCVECGSGVSLKKYENE